MITKNLKLEYYPRVNEDIIEKGIQLIIKNKDHWDDPFFTDVETHVDLEAIKQALSQYNLAKMENVIVLGTGGSIQTLTSLKHLSKKTIYEISSSRSVELQECLDKTKPENSIVIPISRGGETLDINSTIGIFLEKKYQFLGLSSQGTMYDLLKEIECPILDVPDLSGRFAGSISNVGIAPSFIAEINVKEFLVNLNNSYEKYMTLEKNDATEFAIFINELYKKGYKVVFSLPYSKNLEGSAGLFVQELSESTGKDGKGLMGAFQAAPLAQHSVLEYLLGGTKGAIIPFLWIIEKDVPDLVLSSSIDYVNGKTAQEIVNYQADATFQALIEQGVPSAKISLGDPSEKSVAQLIAFIQSTVYYTCLLLNVNWANNPKVVIGKKICNEALQSKKSAEERLETRKEIAKKKFSNFF